MSYPGSTLRLILVAVAVFAMSGAALAQSDELPAMPVDPSSVRALVVGVNKYEQDCVAVLDTGDVIPVFADLNYSEDDARAVAAVLEEVYGYDVHLLLSEDATRDRVLDEFNWLAAAGPSGAAIFYFSGHGSTVEGKADVNSRRGAYIIPFGTKLKDIFPKLAAGSATSTTAVAAADAGPSARVPLRADALTSESLEARALPIQTLVDRLTGSDVKHAVLIFDACCSGYQLDGILSRGDYDAADRTNELRFSIFERPSRAVFTAGTELGKAYEGPLREEHQTNKYLAIGAGHGWYTTSLIRVLVDSEQTALTADEVHFRVANETLHGSGGMFGSLKMEPQRRVTGNGNFVWVKKPVETWLAQVKEEVERPHHARIADGDRGEGPASGPARPAGGPARPAGGPAGRPAGGPAGAAGKQQQAAAPPREVLEANAGRLDLLAAAAKAAEIRTQGPQNLSDDPRWQAWRDRCILRASGGDPDAMAALYYGYQFGIAVPQNDRAARSWSREGLDTGDSVAKLVYELSLASGGRLDQKMVDEANKEEEAAATKAVGGSLVAMEGIRQGNASAAALGALVAASGFAGLGGGDSIDSVINRAVRARDAFAEEVAKPARIRDANRISSSLGSLSAAAQKLDAFARSDAVDSEFYDLAPAVCYGLKQAIYDYHAPTRWNGRSPQHMAGEVNRRFDELFSLYVARTAAMNQSK